MDDQISISQCQTFRPCDYCGGYTVDTKMCTEADMSINDGQIRREICARCVAKVFDTILGPPIKKD